MAGPVALTCCSRITRLISSLEVSVWSASAAGACPGKESVKRISWCVFCASLSRLVSGFQVGLGGYFSPGIPVLKTLTLPVFLTLFRSHEVKKWLSGVASPLRVTSPEVSLVTLRLFNGPRLILHR